MKKKVIALYGSSQEGKSTVLRNVIKYFKPEMELSDDQDYCIAVNVNNKLVGISTAGDDFDIYHSLYELKEMKCELFITASRTKGSSCNAIKRIQAVFLCRKLPKFVLYRRINNNQLMG